MKIRCHTGILHGGPMARLSGAALLLPLLFWSAGQLPLAAKPRIPGRPVEASINEIAQALPASQNQLPGEVRQWMEQVKVLDSRGASTEALALQQKVAAWVRAHPWVGETSTASSLHVLGRLYLRSGQPVEALGPTQKAVAIYQKVAQKNSEFQGDLANALSLLGTVYSALGRRAEALQPTLGALFISLEIIITQEPNIPAFLGVLDNSLTTLADFYSELGPRPEALPLAVQMVEISRDLTTKIPAFKSVHAKALTYLGTLYSSAGRHFEALPHTLKAVEIYRELEASNPAFQGNLASALSNLGAINSKLGRPAEALPPSLEAVKIHRQLAASNPAFLPDLAESSFTLAGLRLSQGDSAGAAPLLRVMVSSEVRYLQGQLPLLPEGRRQPLIETFRRRWEAVFSLAGGSPEGASLALFTRLNRHGLLLDIERRQALLSRAPGPQQRLAQELAAHTSRLADVSLAEPKREALQQQREQKEQELYRLLPAFQPRLVKPDEVARGLPADGVLVEFQRFRPFDANQPEEKAWGDARYLALLLRPDEVITAVDLGAAAAIDKVIEKALAATQKELPDAQDSWKLVADRILVPLRPQLAGRRRWFLSLDGELHRVPFEALRVFAAAGQQPAQRVQLRLLTSGRDLLQGPSNTGNGGQSLVLADPETVDWPLLPATGKEGRQVARDLGATLHEGKQASVYALQQARGPKVLHVASYGYFDEIGASGDPLLGSAIVLAGADRRALPNQHPTGQPAALSSAPEDGYLTAKEAAQLQLDGTQLVVLSACDTGVGRFQSGEGVYGLQRALTVAGARSTLLSLWKVDDEATAWFMRRYYEQIKGGRGRMDALLAVQEEFRTRPKLPGWRHPIYWAAWQLTGDGDPLSK
jgi:CHAT domain-containing protein/tetratricopeptide (TPR) repeat protein